MPRHADPKVEGRVVEAARKLWHKGGEKALSMRAVAKLAGTNTPALYRRFRNREDILKALVRSYQQQLFHLIQSCNSLQEVARSYLEVALEHTRSAGDCLTLHVIHHGSCAGLPHAQPPLQQGSGGLAELLHQAHCIVE